MRARWVHPGSEAESYITIPKNVLRRKIGYGVNLQKIFTPEKINQCQGLIDQTMAGFLHGMENQLAAVHAELTGSLESPEQRALVLKKAFDMASVIRRSMEELNYTFGFNVAKSLCDYLAHASGDAPDVLLVVYKHMEVLNLIVRDRIKGNGGEMGREVLANLHSLVQKTHQK